MISNLQLLDECPQGGARVGLAHEGFAHQETAEAGLAQLPYRFGTGDAAFRHQERAGGQEGSDAEGVLHVGVERAQVAVVHAQHVRFFGSRIVQFPFAVHFQQHFQSQFAGLAGQRGIFADGERRGDEQHGVGPYQPCLVELVFVDDEFLAQDGDGHHGAGRADEVRRSAEVVRVGQDGKGGGPGFGVCGGNDVCSSVFLDPTL